MKRAGPGLSRLMAIAMRAMSGLLIEGGEGGEDQVEGAFDDPVEAVDGRVAQADQG